MRRLTVASLLALALVTATACGGPSDPNSFETYVPQLDDAAKRSEAMKELTRLVKSAQTANAEDRLKEFAEKVIPKFVEIWDGAVANREEMLQMARDAAQPQACELWKKAIVLDGSADSVKFSMLALQGIRESKAMDCVEAVAAELDKNAKEPKFDSGEQAGVMRLEFAKTLGELKDKRGVPALLATVNASPEKQPQAVYREAIKALGLIRDASAIPALLEVTFRVPDENSTTDIFNRTMLALASIGEPAVEPTLATFRGQNESIMKLAAEQQLDDASVKTIASQFLGALGSKKATADLVAFMPKDDCVPPDPTAKKKPGEEAPEPDAGAGALRMMIARQLGYIGDPEAAPALCQCTMATRNFDQYEVAQALGWIGGEQAYTCLVDVVKKADYSDDAVASSDFRYEIRWQAVRFAVLASPPDKISMIKDAVSGNDQEKVKTESKQWDAGIALVESCKSDKECYLKTLNDQSAEWFPREVAAHQLARIAPGDKEVALAISKAFKVRNPDARVSMAILADRVLQGGDCQECAEAIEGIIDGEKGTMDATMQLAVTKARQTIAKLEVGG